MLPKHHFFLGLLFVTLLHFLFPELSFFSLSIIFLSSFLIDVDHVVYYFLKEKTFNLFESYKKQTTCLKDFINLPRKERKKIYLGFYFLHGVEWLIILFLLGFYIHNFFFLIFIGFSFHLSLDFIYERYLGCSFDKSSLIWNFYRFRKLNI